MWLKNLQIYRITGGTITASDLEEALSRHALQNCLQMEMQSRGWVVPRDDKENFVHVFGQQLLIAFGVEKKLLPTAVINQHAKARIVAIEQMQGYKVGKKQTRDIKEAALIELLPRAFVLRSKTYVWIDLAGERVIIDTTNVKKADELLEMLFKVVDNLSLALIETQVSPSTAMTRWLSGDELPSVFTIDRDCELQGMDDEKSTIRYTHHVLDAGETIRHIKAGKKATRLAMTWDNKISFVLHDNLQLRRIAPLDIIKESAETTEELFESDFAIMTGELGQLLPDLIDALGGVDKAN